MKLRSLSSVIPAIAVLLIAACGAATGAGGNAPSAAGSTAAQSAAAGLVPVKVTTLGLCNESYLYWGMDKGIFANHGLSVTTVKTQGGSAGIAAIVSGAADFSFTNGFTAILSLNAGFPIKIISGAYDSPQPPLPPSQALFVKDGSPITSPTQLVGKKVGVNEIGGINHIVTVAWLKKLGVNPEDVNFVALSFPNIVAGVVSGRIDAGQAALANIGTAAVHSLGDPFREAVPKVVFGSYITTNDFIAKHPGVSEKFQAAIAESIKQITDPANTDAQFALAAKNCGNKPDVLAKQPQQQYDAYVDVNALQNMGKILIDQGYLKAVPDLNNLVPEFARSK